MAKPSRKQREAGGFVYATDGSHLQPAEEPQQATLPPAQQTLRLRQEKVKGNKRATLVRGFVGNDDDRKALALALKRYCGVGGSVVEEGAILLQGEVLPKATQYLKDAGYTVKAS